MSREYLFRGKRVDNGEWVEGFLIKGNRTYIVTREAIEYMVVSLMGMASLELVEVIPETVGQFTGLTDKNGKKIFEDDVFAYRYKNLKGKEITRFYVITYDNELGYWSPFGNSDYGFYAKDIEIIGNIIDNKELLGE